MMTYSFFILFYLIQILIPINSSSILLNRLRKHKTISFQSKLSSPIEINLNENTKFNLTCSFLSNFNLIDIFWLHNGTLIQSFISKNLLKEEEDETFLAVSIVSTIHIDKIHFDMNGFYQCIAVHREIYAQQTFYVNINLKETNLIETNFSRDSFITVHTSQALFETRDTISLMCRIGNQNRNQCKIKWFDPSDNQIDLLGENNDLVIKNATFDENMGLYTCHICCENTCQKLTSFIYPAAID